MPPSSCSRNAIGMAVNFAAGLLDDREHPFNDRKVELELRDEGWGYKRLAKHIDISTRTVRGICNCTIRAQTPMRFR